ncbi:MAG: peptide deformylase [Candidatus Lokiarchaeota archaeon]|nr:peptide deformylase [Candidatus Lokiarchaeota archaeon]
MPVKEVLLLGNNKLREKSIEVNYSDENLNVHLEDLKDTLNYLIMTKKVGRAIAAPQIGWKKRVIFYNLKEKSFYMINPIILSKSEEIFEVWDSCFCFEVEFFVQIERYKKIEVEYFDQEAVKKVETFTDDLSELIQHEIDHLNGILATDHLKDPGKIIMRSEWERRFK